MISQVTVQFQSIYSETFSSVESGNSAACTRNSNSCWQYVLGQFYKDTAGLRDDPWFLVLSCVSQSHNFRKNLPIFKEPAYIAVLRQICLHRLQHWQHKSRSNIRITLEGCYRSPSTIIVHQIKCTFPEFRACRSQKLFWLIWIPPPPPPPHSYFGVVVGLAWSHDPDSNAGGSIVTGSVVHAGYIKGDDPGQKLYPGPPGWDLGIGLITHPVRSPNCWEAFNDCSRTEWPKCRRKS
jgi:hypothetical protein